MEIPGGLCLPQRSPPHAVEVCLEPGRARPWGLDGDLELKGVWDPHSQAGCRGWRWDPKNPSWGVACQLAAL